tara:strand:+ start:14616 stop:15089 length:474 start_codon:yes stop_codon:yes gene_type:complete
VSDNDNLIFFPTDKIVREIKTKKQETEYAKKIKTQQTKEFVEHSVDDIAFDLLRKFVDIGIRTKNDNFTKDLAIVIDSIRGLVYRDFDMAHPAQLLSTKMVQLKTMRDGTHKSAKIDYSSFMDETKPRTTRPLSKDIKDELTHLQDGGDMFTPDDEL